MAGRAKKSFLLRIDPDLWAELERLAAQELRSVNGQIEYMLRSALRQRGRLRNREAEEHESRDSE